MLKGLTDNLLTILNDTMGNPQLWMCHLLNESRSYQALLHQILQFQVVSLCAG